MRSPEISQHKFCIFVFPMCAACLTCINFMIQFIGKAPSYIVFSVNLLVSSRLKKNGQVHEMFSVMYIHPV
jgi:hypothetical protein